MGKGLADSKAGCSSVSSFLWHSLLPALQPSPFTECWCVWCIKPKEAIWRLSMGCGKTEDFPEAQPQGLIRSFHCRLVRLAIADNVTGMVYTWSCPPQSPRRTQRAQSPSGLTLQALQIHLHLLQWVGVQHPETGFKVMRRMPVSWLTRQVTTALNRTVQASNRNCLYQLQVFPKPRSQCQALSTWSWLLLPQHGCPRQWLQ